MTQKRYDQLIKSHRGFANASMRDVIFPALLGKETDGILYWIGKDLAREYPVATNEELIELTSQLDLGCLSLKKKATTSQLWELSGPIVAERVMIDKEKTSFSLEAGFLAQECEFQLGAATEAIVQNCGRKVVTILVQNDPQNDSNECEIVKFIHPLVAEHDDASDKVRG